MSFQESLDEARNKILGLNNEVEITREQLENVAIQAAERSRELEQERELGSKSFRELEEDIEDANDEDDIKALEAFRQKRISEMMQKAAKAKYGELVQIGEPEYIPEVTQAKDVWVVVLLFQRGLQACDVVERCLQTLARKFRAVKFLRIIATQAIRNYPDKNVPTVLVYKDGACRKQFIGIDSFGGLGVTAEDLEWQLHKLGVVETDLEEDPQNSRKTVSVQRSGFVGRRGRDDDDDEEDN